MKKYKLNATLIIGNIIAILSAIFLISLNNGYIKANDSVIAKNKNYISNYNIAFKNKNNLSTFISKFKEKCPNDLLIFKSLETVNTNKSYVNYYVGDNGNVAPYNVPGKLKDKVYTSKYVAEKNNSFTVDGIKFISNETIKEDVKIPTLKYVTFIPFNKITKYAYLESLTFSEIELYSDKDNTIEIDKILKSLQLEYVNNSNVDNALYNDTEDYKGLTYIIIILNILVSIIIVTFWIKDIKNEIAIMKAIGFDNGGVNRIVFKELLVNYIITFILAIALFFILRGTLENYTSFKIDFNKWSLIIPSVLTLLLTMLMLFVATFGITEISPSEILNSQETTLWSKKLLKIILLI